MNLRALLTVAWCVLAVAWCRADAPATLVDYVKKSAGRTAHGLYVLGKKAGWGVDEVKLGQLNGQQVAILSGEMYLAITIGGQKTVISEKRTSYHELTGEGLLVQHEEVKTENNRTVTLKAVRQGKEMLVTKQTGDRVEERRVPIPKASLKLSQALEQWLSGERKAGDTFDDWSTDWSVAQVDKAVKNTFVSRRKVVFGGVEADVNTLNVKVSGAQYQLEVRSDGKVVRGVIGGLIEIRTEPEQLAKKLDESGPAVDLLEASSIFIDQDLGRSDRVKKLVLEIKGLGDFALPESHRQKITRRDGETTIVELYRDFRVDQPSPLSDQEKAQYTQATPTIQSDNERIVKLARKIVGQETDPLKQADLLKSYVHRKMRPVLGANAATALDVLETMAGDCTEHTLLFVALARAVGLPAREVGGVGYAKTDRPFFGWHAWAQIHDGRQWVSVDPTWNQLFADGTHLQFQTDADDQGWITTLGKLRIRVLSVDKGD
jgi:hypothetical protein